VTTFWRQLKWRIVAANMVVVVVGVVTMLLMAFIAARTIIPISIEAVLSELTEVGVGEGVSAGSAAITAELLDTFRQSVTSALLVAAASAVIVGIGASLLLMREILKPLRQIAWSSRRIAGGHYDERISVPNSDELAQVATNFNEMAAALARMEQTRVSLIGDISHELRTPLTGLAGYLEGMMDGLFPADEETMALMSREVRRMRRLVDDLQILSKVEAGQIALKLDYFDIRESVRRVIAQLQPQWHAQAVEVDVEVPSTAVIVYADSDRVTQILLNLVGNALAYTPEGNQILLSIIIEDRYARTTVQDSGIGIDPEQLPYLFERFFRADRSRARSSGGSGIGLTISRHLAWAMGGELTAASEGAGKGSTFSFTLPMAG
jgi:histidine kinase